MIRTLVRIVTWPALTTASLLFDTGAAISNPVADWMWAENLEPPPCPFRRMGMQIHDVIHLLFRPDPAYMRPDRPNAYLLALEEVNA